MMVSSMANPHRASTTCVAPLTTATGQPVLDVTGNPLVAPVVTTPASPPSLDAQGLVGPPAAGPVMPMVHFTSTGTPVGMGQVPQQVSTSQVCPVALPGGSAALPNQQSGGSGMPQQGELAELGDVTEPAFLPQVVEDAAVQPQQEAEAEAAFSVPPLDAPLPEEAVVGDVGVAADGGVGGGSGVVSAAAAAVAVAAAAAAEGPEDVPGVAGAEPRVVMDEDMVENLSAADDADACCSHSQQKRGRQLWEATMPHKRGAFWYNNAHSTALPKGETVVVQHPFDTVTPEDEKEQVSFFGVLDHICDPDGSTPPFSQQVLRKATRKELECGTPMQMSKKSPRLAVPSPG